MNFLFYKFKIFIQNLLIKWAQRRLRTVVRFLRNKLLKLRKLHENLAKLKGDHSHDSQSN